MVEILFKIYALRSSYFKNKMEVCNMLIVTISLLMDTIFFRTNTATFIAEIVIALRLWRITRIIHGWFIHNFKTPQVFNQQILIYL